MLRWIGAAALTTTALTGIAASPAAAASAVAVTVNADSGLGTVPSGAIGVNSAVYDGDMNDSAVSGLLKTAGIDAVRYPGGSDSDVYDWQTGTAAGGAYVASNTGFSAFMGTTQAAGASAVLTVNYGTGTPALAAAWVKDADVTNDYGVKYWEIGNEVFGNGTYGSNWEADSHCTDSSGNAVTVGSEPSQTYNCGPSVYAANVLSYISAMKAVSSSIHVCAVLTTPGFWPDGVTNSTTSPESWNQTVLTALGSKTDCVIVHYYPGGSSTAGMLTDPTGIAGIVSTLHSEISEYAGVNAANVPIMVTETNPTIDLDTQPGALYAADTYMTWMENGAVNIDWWDEHNGASTPSTVDGAQDYGDQGILSNGTSSGGVSEPAADTPFAPYYGIEMLSKLASPGDTMVSASSGNALVRVHAVRQSSGGLSVLIDNEDPSNSYTANLTYNGFTGSGNSTVYTLANNGTSITSATQSSASSVTVAPYTITVIKIPESGSSTTAAPSAPGQPTVSNLASSSSSTTSGSATLTWAASTPGTYSVADYQVYQVASDGSTTLAATTSATTLNLTGLTVGASYSYDVVAVDTQGNASPPSSAVDFTVPVPAGSSCTASYSSSSWTNGFSGTITLTNNASTAINGWTLTFTWPAAGEAVQYGYGNGTWTQSGLNVTVTNASYNGTIAANGGSLSLGFNGTDTGQDPAPTVFFLNGTACSTS